MLSFLANGGEGTMPSQQVCDGEETVLNSSTFTREGFFFAGWATSSDAETAQFVDGGIIAVTADQTLYAVWSSNCVDRESNRMVIACDNYRWNDSTYTTSGEYTRISPDVVPGGCDSIYRLHLTIKYSTENLQQITACQPYTWIDGHTYTSDTIRQLSMTNTVGCDSLVTLQLVMSSGIYVTETVTACDSYEWQGTTYTASTNTPNFTTTSAAGCDSTVTLNLTINYSTTGTETITACDSYEWHEVTYTSSTSTPSYASTNSVGCDSVATLHLTINYSVETTVRDTAEGSYTWHDTTYTESGTYQWQGTTNAGCDSTVTLMLVVNSVGIEVIDGSGISVVVYPNPTTGWITIDADDVLSVEVFDQAGRKVATYEQTNRIYLGGLASGNYMLKIHLQRGQSVQRVILK